VLAFKQKNVRERVDRFSFRGTILMSATSGIGRDTERERGTRGNGNSMVLLTLGWFGRWKNRLVSADSMEGAFNSGLALCKVTKGV
jgi:hypothetical protein